MAGCSGGWPQFLAPQEVGVTFHDPKIPSKITLLILCGWPKAPRQFWSSMTFQGLRDYLPEAESKVQTSIGARLNSLPHRYGTCDLKNIMSTQILGFVCVCVCVCVCLAALDLCHSPQVSLVAVPGLSCPKACRILVPQWAIELTSSALEDGFWTTGPWGKSLNFVFNDSLHVSREEALNARLRGWD